MRVAGGLAAVVLAASGALLVAAPAASAAVACPVLSGVVPYTVTPAPSPGVDWSGCDLSDADLRNTTLTGAVLSGANLSYALLTNALMSGSTLTGTDFTHARLSRADLTGSNLTNAQLTQANMNATSLTDVFVACGTGGVLGTAILNTPVNLPSGWAFDTATGTLTAPVTPCPPSAAGSGIPAWVQSYGRFGADATCETGWSPSWQEWAEDITGGWVCTRTVSSLG